MKADGFMPSTSSWRDRVAGWLSHSQIAAFAEILIMVAIYLLKINGWLPMSKIPILLLASISFWLRGSGWRQVGMDRPASWQRTIILGVAIAMLDNSFGLVVTLPLLHRFTGETIDLSQFNAMRGDIGALVLWLTLSWTYAALVEEMVYRGYLLNRLADLFGRNQIGWLLGLTISSVMFGLVHGSMGISGVLNTSLSGVLYAAAYLLFGRNLWIPIIIHGLGNSIGLVMIYFGLYP